MGVLRAIVRVIVRLNCWSSRPVSKEGVDKVPRSANPCQRGPKIDPPKHYEGDFVNSHCPRANSLKAIGGKHVKKHPRRASSSKSASVSTLKSNRDLSMPLAFDVLTPYHHIINSSAPNSDTCPSQSVTCSSTYCANSSYNDTSSMSMTNSDW